MIIWCILFINLNLEINIILVEGNLVLQWLTIGAT